MSSQLDKKRQKFRQNLRRIQLQNRFKQIRQRLKDSLPQNTNQRFLSHLQTLKTIIKHPQQCMEYIQQLKQINRVTQEYNIISILSQNFSLNSQQRQEFQQSNKKLQNYHTWIDLLLFIIKQDFPQEIYEECINILVNCAYQLKQFISKDNHLEQMKRILQNYPYGFIKKGSNTMIINSLKIVYFLSISGNKLDFLYYLLNKSTPSVLKMLHSLYKNNNALALPQVRKEYISTSLTLIALIYQYNLQNYQPQLYSLNRTHLQEIILSQLHNSKNKEQFSNNCQYIRIMINIDFQIPDQQEFIRISNYFPRSIEECNTAYFHLMETILYHSQKILPSQRIKDILQFIFNKQNLMDFDKLKNQLYLLKIFNYHTLNCKNHIRKEDIAILKDLWGSNNKAENLIDLAEAIYTYYPNKFKILIEILSRLLTDEQDQLFLIENTFSPLLKYKSYREMIVQLGYAFQDEDEL